MPSIPFCASSTEYPSDWRSISRPSRIASSSSTTRTLPRAAAVSGCIYRLPCGAGCGEWKFQTERGATVAPVGHFDRTTMFLHNTVRHRKAESRAFAGRFGGEEGVVDAVDVLGGNAVPGVRDLHPDAGAFGPGPDFQGPAGAHRVASVEEEIQEDLLEFTRVPVDRRKIGVEVRLDLDSGLLQLMFEERERLLDDPIQADVAEGRGRRAREVQQRVDDLARAEGLLGD